MAARLCAAQCIRQASLHTNSDGAPQLARQQCLQAVQACAHMRSVADCVIQAESRTHFHALAGRLQACAHMRQRPGPTALGGGAVEQQRRRGSAQQYLYDR
jgi:hypothetical protein